MKIKLTLLLISTLLTATISAQQTFTITDSLPVTVNGLKAGYTIKDTDLDSKKNGQSKYKIYFYLTNTSTESKILYKSPAFGHFGPVSNVIATFKCSNATGARLTNKLASMELQPCKIEAVVEDKDCSTGKVVKNTRQVEIGYWIKPGETISSTSPMYVPQNEKPNMTITFYSESNNQMGTFISSNYSDKQITTDFIKLKNFASNNYINNQNGPAVCSVILPGWWSAEWQIISVPGTNNFQIKNHWKNNFISTDNIDFISDNGQSMNAMWTLEPTVTANVYYIKNVANNSKLVDLNGTLKISNAGNTAANAQWSIEKL